ncbi:NAD-dependent epimerase/dehydratase family protein [Roseivivax marinus]|uniref:NAD-dependent epimerase/dehydratase family protein n=1 Tax=Roseivivax marinus TaxID=1379903 RepID=UPI00273D14E3|nr:NAD-dependent epimerase/dehydratase family protein [Roseivivax marinus]
MTSALPTSDRPVLILGGGGFLGINMTERLLAEGRPVINYSRSWLVRRDRPEARYVSAADGDLEALEGLIRESAVVYHMAHGFSAATPRHVVAERLPALLELNDRIMRTCRDAGVPLVYVSSGGTVYGKVEQVPTPEDAPTAPINFYGVSKLAAERHFLAQPGPDTIVLRVSNPYGPWQYGTGGQGVIGTWMRAVLQGQSLTIRGDGRAERDYVFVDDVVDAMLRAGEVGGSGTVLNVGFGEGRSLNDLLAAFRELFPGAVDCNYVDAAPSDVPVSVLDVSRAKDLLGWTPRTAFDDGLAKTRAWMERHVGGTPDQIPT